MVSSGRERIRPMEVMWVTEGIHLSVDLPFRAMSLSPFESLEIAGFET